MVLVSLVLFMKAFYPEHIEDFREKFKVDSNNEITYSEYNGKSRKTILGMVFMVLFILLNVLPAFMIANSCNRNIILKIIIIPFAILFSDIYVFFHILRVYGFKKGLYGFCGNLNYSYKD